MLTTVETNRLKAPENNLALVGNHNYGSLNQREKILQKLVSTIPKFLMKVPVYKNNLSIYKH